MENEISFTEAQQVGQRIDAILTTAVEARDEARAVAREILYGFLTLAERETFLRLYPWLEKRS